MNQERQSIAKIQVAEKDKATESASKELIQLESKLNQADSELNQIKIELNQSKLDLMQSKRSISKLENRVGIEGQDYKIDSRELIQLESELNQLQKDNAKLESAMKAKDDEVSFLRAHVSELTQSISQLSLKPGEEEIKKRDGGNSGNESSEGTGIQQVHLGQIFLWKSLR